MSTILKALQRLEQEKEPAQPSGAMPVFSRPQTTAGGVAGWFMNPWVRRTAMGLVIIALGATATYYYRQSQTKTNQQAERSAAREKTLPFERPRRQQPEVPTVVPGEIQKADSTRGQAVIISDPSTVQAAPVLAPKPRATEFKPAVQQPVLPKAARTGASRVAQSTKPPVSGDVLGRQPNRTNQPAKPEETAAVENQAPPKDNPTDARLPVKTEAKSMADIGKKVAPDTYGNTPQLTDGRLKIHAIAWSPSVEERMAVVNNRVVYEGDSVDSFIVVAIQPDDVVVREKDKGMWKVVFGRP